MHNKILILIIILSMLTVSACTSKTMPEPVQPELTYEQQVIVDYQELLKISSNSDAIEPFLYTHLINLNTNYCDSMVKAYEEYLSIDLETPEEKLHLNLIDYSNLLKYSPYLSLEYASYIKLFADEYLAPNLNTTPIYIDIPELLIKAANVEHHLIKYKDGDTEQKMYELYVRYLYAAIMNNGYSIDLEANPEILDAYNDFIDIYPDYHTSNLVQYYKTLLSNNNYNIESNSVQNFYFNFYSMLRSFLWDNQPIEQN